MEPKYIVVYKEFGLKSINRFVSRERAMKLYDELLKEKREGKKIKHLSLSLIEK